MKPSNEMILNWINESSDSDKGITCYYNEGGTYISLEYVTDKIFDWYMSQE